MTEISVNCLERYLMAVTLNTVIEEPSLAADYEHLRRCWESQIESRPKMNADWAVIGEMVYSSFSVRYHASSQLVTETDRLKSLARLSKDIYANLCNFRSSYVEFMDNSQISNLDGFISMSLSRIKSSEATQCFYQSEISKDRLEKLKLMKAGMCLYSESLSTNFSHQLDLVNLDVISADDYEDALNSLKTFLVFTSNLADDILSSEQGFGRLFEMRSLQRYIKDTALSLISQIGSISGKKESLDYFLSDFEGSLVVLENQSAEAKAIRRIQAATNEDDWELVCSPADQIDVDDLDRQLRACGYID